MPALTTAPARLLAGAIAALAAIAGVCAIGLTSAQSRERSTPAGSVARVAGLAQGEFGQDALRRILARMDPATRSLAFRHDPERVRAARGGVPGWETLDLTTAPSLGLRSVRAEDARLINAFTPATSAPVVAAQPFVLRARTVAERDRAIRCLTAAVYYEAALEPIDGQRAVAQVVLNRLRDHNYPKSVCGVVWQGWERWTGCQFSFTCDGSLLRAPTPVLWERARGVATAALDGYVQPQVGVATHYHADYVLPYWSPTLVKIGQIGAHIFYRWTGPAGQPGAFTGRYAGNEFAISDAALSGRAARPTPPPTLLADGEDATADELGDDIRAVQVADPADGTVSTRYVARLSIGGRRTATPEDVARINDSLRRYESGAPAALATPAVAPPPAGASAMPVTEVNRPAA